MPVRENCSRDRLFVDARPRIRDHEFFAPTCLEEICANGMEAFFENNLTRDFGWTVQTVIIDNKLISDEQTASIIG